MLNIKNRNRNVTNRIERNNFVSAILSLRVVSFRSVLFSLSTMQRQAGTSRAVELPQTSQPRLVPFSSPKGKIEEAANLPLYKRNSSVGKKENLKSRLPEKLVHLIPVAVLLCFFILWCFSYSVNFDSKEEWIAAARLMAQNATFFPPFSWISGVQLLNNDSYSE
ncbi:hypothetical protein SASPL_120142 [Salvia splendens]|uniref:Uncharacterized protein n=1 Tax=Salvia splendens TaxID=180675 RepID=A0A8X8XP40_SALSN|nr:uncharacterized protein LOC121742437 isoform X2 [Salvia splendens]KAG6417945.1 hypothetical protein SASPL_120142 [Salvia splendens]